MMTQPMLREEMAGCPRFLLIACVPRDGGRAVLVGRSGASTALT